VIVIRRGEMIDNTINRIDLLIRIFMETPGDLTISDIEKEFIKRNEGVPSLETIENDLLEMINKNVIYQCSSDPLTFSMVGAKFASIMDLYHEEILLLISVLPSSHPLSLRLKEKFSYLQGEHYFEDR
jgi:hypothetical protein